jgi:hypothetical protein
VIFGGLWLIVFLVIHIKAFRFSPRSNGPAAA